MSDTPQQKRFRAVHTAVLGAGGLVMAMVIAAYAAVDAEAARETDNQQGFAPHLELDAPVVLEGADGAVYLRLHFEVPEEPDRILERPRVNLALVIDRSGSMDDKGKMGYAQRAANMIVDRLAARDRLSVVEYDDEVTVLWPAGPVDGRDDIKRRINSLFPRGSTDLTGGMMKGVSQLRSYAGEEGALTRVVLLSDGLANQGVTDPAEIRALVGGARRDGVSITTLGLGLDYNEDLMETIAEAGGGAYYYVEHPNQLARIFERELDTMFLTAARNCIIRIEATSGVTGMDVYGHDVGRNGGQDGSATLIPMSDFYAGESRSLLVRLDLKGQREGNVKLGTVRFNYLDVATGEPRETVSELTIDVSPSADAVAAARNDAVVVEATLARAERRQSEALALFEAGQPAEARALMNETADDLKARNRVMQDVRVANKIEALVVENEQMELAAASPDMAADFTKSSKQRLYQARKGKRGLYMLQQGDRGYAVEVLQQALNEAGYYSGPIDGAFDDEVAAALEKFQASENLRTDAIAGPETMSRLGVY